LLKAKKAVFENQLKHRYGLKKETHMETVDLFSNIDRLTYCLDCKSNIM